jgi:DNA-directed RNA polymerase subunit M/transcription elongation factor TFIIS
MIKDIPKPKVACPECKHTEMFYHCALQINGEVYDWGTLVTCLNCKCPITIKG